MPARPADPGSRPVRGLDGAPADTAVVPGPGRSRPGGPWSGRVLRGRSWSISRDGLPSAGLSRTEDLLGAEDAA